jgi:hypothetical protein
MLVSLIPRGVQRKHAQGDDQMATAGRTATEQAIIDDELAALRFHWDTAYQIEFDDEHGWRARRIGSQHGWLTAADPDGLYKKIREDYSPQLLPRRHAPGKP